MNILESMNRGLEQKYSLNEADVLDEKTIKGKQKKSEKTRVVNKNDVIKEYWTNNRYIAWFEANITSNKEDKNVGTVDKSVKFPDGNDAILKEREKKVAKKGSKYNVPSDCYSDGQLVKMAKQWINKFGSNQDNIDNSILMQLKQNKIKIPGEGGEYSEKKYMDNGGVESEWRDFADYIIKLYGESTLNKYTPSRFKGILDITDGGEAPVQGGGITERDPSDETTDEITIKDGGEKKPKKKKPTSGTPKPAAPREVTVPLAITTADTTKKERTEIKQIWTNDWKEDVTDKILDKMTSPDAQQQPQKTENSSYKSSNQKSSLNESDWGRISSREQIENLRKKYYKGARVELVYMDDPQAPRPGTRGSVRGVDDIGDIMVDWDNGSSLNVVPGVDKIIKLADKMRESRNPELKRTTTFRRIK